MPFQSSLSLYQCMLLPICTVATVQLLYAIPVFTVTISVHAVTNLSGSHSTVTVCDWSPHCHYISTHCYQSVRWPQYSYCMRLESSLSLFQCTLLPICTVATVQLLYAIPILLTNSFHCITKLVLDESECTFVFHVTTTHIYFPFLPLK